jgi:hypothetical protein
VQVEDEVGGTARQPAAEVTAIGAHQLMAMRADSFADFTGTAVLAASAPILVAAAVELDLDADQRVGT